MDSILVDAARGGSVNMLRQPPFANSNLLLQSTPLGNTALHIAVRFGHVPFSLELYQQRHSLVCMRNLQGDTPLHIASRTGHASIVIALVKEIISATTPFTDVQNGEEVHSLDILRMGNGEGDTILHEAIRNSHLEIVMLLTQEDPVLWCLTNNAHESPLFLAIQECYEDIVSQALGLPTYSSFAHSGPNGRTTLHAAVIGRHPGMIDILIQKKQELIREQDEHGRTPLHYAASNGDLRIVHQLLESDASNAYLFDKDGRSPLHEAATNGDLYVMEDLLDHCPDLGDLPDVRGQNALHIAIKNRKLEVVQYLLSKNELVGLINQQDIDGNTPLHVVTFHCLFGIVRTLSFDSRVDMRVVNDRNLTALDIVEQDMEHRRTIFQKFFVSVILKVASHARYPELMTSRKTKPPVTTEPTSTRESYKDMVNTLSVVATLIATIAFAAALTMPGGYKSDGGPDQGTAVLIKKAAFKAFVIFDAGAISNSLAAVFLLVWATVADREAFVGSIVFASYLTWTALVGMGLAFATGFYAVLSDVPWLAIYVCLITCLIPVTLAYLPKCVQWYS